MPERKNDNYVKGVLFILLAALGFGCMSFFVRLSGDLPSVEKSFFRNVVALLFATGILIREKIPLTVKKECRFPLLVRCTFGTLGILCNFYAIDHLLLANANILNKLSPFFAVIFSFFILKEKIKPIQIFCLILAFFGCLCIVKPGGESVAVFPALMGVLGGLGAGLAYTMVRKMGMYDMKGPVIVFYFSVFSTLIVIPWIITNFVMPSPRQLIFLICAGLGAACGQFSITAAYKCAPAREISIYDYSQIIFATILGYLFFDEIPDVLSFLGYALIVGASLFMFLYNKRTISADKAKMVS